jgi:hypothetical protein
MLARDTCRFVLRRLRVTRAAAALVAVAALGATLSFGYYPLLARQISPKEVFESFQRLSRPGEELAMIGGGLGGARYYARRDVRSLSTVQEAFSWLTEKDGERRWLVVRASDIGQLNSQFRARRTPAHNLPVLDARSSEILLVSNQLRSEEKNENPFAKWVLDARPSPGTRGYLSFSEQRAVNDVGDNAGADIHLRLLQAMGFDLASIHAADPRGTAAITADLDKRPRGWLNAAAEATAIEVRRDLREWKKAVKKR